MFVSKMISETNELLRRQMKKFQQQLEDSKRQEMKSKKAQEGLTR